MEGSLRCIQVIAGVLGRAGEDGQRKRLEKARTGEVTWLPPPGLGKPMTEEDRIKEAEARKAAKNFKRPSDQTRGGKKRFDPDNETDEI